MAQSLHFRRGQGTPTDPRPSIVALNQPGALVQDLVGSKALRLARLLRAGFPVPNGFCVTTRAFDLWLATLRGSEPVRQLWQQLESGPTPAPWDLADQLHDLAVATPIPTEIAEVVRAEIQRRGVERPWAVRSSASVEDQSQASFAGQFDTFLEVRGQQATLDAIRRCWTAAFGTRPITYALRQGLSVRAFPMAVLVQEFVQGDWAGVVFTRDPVARDMRRLVIEASPGTGESLVAGRVTPERWVVDRRDLSVVTHTPGDQLVPAVQDTQPSPDSASPGNPPAQVAARSGLDEAWVRHLCRVGVRIERLFGSPQDLEWASRNGQLALLQARPATTPTGSRTADLWVNANAMEALPGVITPMSWSLMELLLEGFLHPLLQRVGLRAPGRPFVGRIAGRAYLNLGVSDLLLRLLSGSAGRDFVGAFGGDRTLLEQALARRSLGQGVVLRSIPWTRLPGFVSWLMRGLPHQSRTIDRWCQRVHDELPRQEPKGLSDEQLADRLPDLLRHVSRDDSLHTWAAAIWMCLALLGGTAAVTRLARRWLDDHDGSLARRLLAGGEDLPSAEGGYALLRLAAWGRAQPKLLPALLEPSNFSTLANRLPEIDGGPEFLRRWGEFMDGHGHQARGGMDVFQPRWSERPDDLLESLRGFLRADASRDLPELPDHRRKERDAIVRSARRRLRSPLRRWVFFALLRVARRGLVQRENAKNEGVRLVALLRRTVQEAGRRLARRRLLEHPDDVFFLRWDELRDVLRRDLPIDTRLVVDRRRRENERLARMEPPAVVDGHPATVDPVTPSRPPPNDAAPADLLHGVPVSPGVVEGFARVIVDCDGRESLLPGEILVAPWTDPGWTPLFLAASGLVVDVGGQLSHGSIVAREFGLPAVANVGCATRVIRTGQRIRVDGSKGIVHLHP